MIHAVLIHAQTVVSVSQVATVTYVFVLSSIAETTVKHVLI